MRRQWMRLLPMALGLVLLPACAGRMRVNYEHPANPPERDQPMHHETGSTYAQQPSLQIPKGHLPKPGSCRIWLPGTPPGRQPRPGDCARLAGEVPAGAWLVYRPANDPEHVDVCVYDAAQPGVPVEIRVYATATGQFVRTRPRP